MNMKRPSKQWSCAEKAWVITGGMLGLLVGWMIMRELPSLRREIRLMSM
jgi:hypothetical protein